MLLFSLETEKIKKSMKDMTVQGEQDKSSTKKKTPKKQMVRTAQTDKMKKLHIQYLKEPQLWLNQEQMVEALVLGQMVAPWWTL